MRSFRFLVTSCCILCWYGPVYSFVSQGIIKSSDRSSGSMILRQGGHSSSSRHSEEKDESSSSLPRTEPRTVTEFMVKVKFDDDFSGTDTIAVRKGESLLSALERSASSQGWSEVPSDCRRGNCLTCCAKHSESSRKDHVKPLSDDGLSPALSINTKGDDERYFLTCRSTVTGPGVELLVGQNSAVWNHMYKTRFESEATRYATDVALARVLRKAAEIDPEAWRQQTEALWNEQQQRGGADEDPLFLEEDEGTE
eukprot:scaffold83_cov181-Amphora_coffeaeformis.AAC.16